MKAFLTLALLAMATIASAQPGHRGKNHNKFNHHKNQKHYAPAPHHRKLVRVDQRRDYHYHVNREINRYDFLRLSRSQRSRLEVSLNFLLSNNYAPRAYELRLRRDLRDILTRAQYQAWERRAYNNSNVFVFNFGR